MSTMLNTEIDITASGKWNLGAVVRIAWPQGKTIEHYAADRATSDAPALLMLLSEQSNGSQSLPYPMDPEAATDFIWGWLHRQYEERPQVEGFVVGKAWRALLDSGNKIDDCPNVVIAIEPAWAYYVREDTEGVPQ